MIEEFYTHISVVIKVKSLNVTLLVMKSAL